jgi:RNA polymerase sigma-70 factor (ECF subfamily)
VGLSQHFLAAVRGAGARAALAAASDLDATLARLVDEGRRAWPDVDLPSEAFVAHVAERLPDDGDARDALAAIRADDLYLACGCTRGDAHALAAFEKHFVADVSSYLAREDALPAFTDEVKQLLRARLLVAESGLVPRIAGYGGRGPLGGWLRTAAARIAIDLRKTQHKGGGAPESAALAAPAAGPDPELGFLKTHAAAEFKAAFESTLAQLSAREANVVRLYFLDGLTMQAVASLYRVSVRTVERWIVRLRRKLLDDTRRRLAERLRVPASQLDDLIQMAQSQLHVSVRRLLSRPDEPL